MKIRLGLVVAALSLVVGACGGGADEPSADDTTTTAPVALVPSAAETKIAAPEATAIMPNVVCMNLQAAQNLIQDAGVFFSTSSDASGAGRMQINDSNWIVVAQTPAPGTTFGEGDADLSVVKTDEPNAC